MQIGYLDGTLKFGQGADNNVFYNGDDVNVGWTVGVNLQPTSTTRIGIGYRSEIQYELEGEFGDNVTGSRFSADVELTTPDIVTISIQQELSERVRLSATYEWTQWSDFNQLDIIANENNSTVVTATSINPFGVELASTLGNAVEGETYASLVADWDDAWFASLGLEVDHTDDLTLRLGIAYEESPIQKAEQRLTAVPDTDRIWASGGFSYKAGNIMPDLLGMGPSNTTIDFAYTHIFAEDGDIERESISNPGVTFEGESDSAVDIISVGLRTKFGVVEEIPFK